MKRKKGETKERKAFLASSKTVFSVQSQPILFIKPIGSVLTPINSVLKSIGFILEPIGFALKLIGFTLKPIGFTLKDIGFVLTPIGLSLFKKLCQNRKTVN